MTKQITYTRTVIGFYNVCTAGSETIIATLSPQQMTALLGYTPTGSLGCAEVNGL
ncbi:hypothetical protein [Domibacillus antri]|uniref:hypothetical protein n=1 Tax=Domibacillus antri TaxID=1714264 RepID=UPI000ABA68B1|nr:hypothetical protein [Domibacillus antri]